MKLNDKEKALIMLALNKLEEEQEKEIIDFTEYLNTNNFCLETTVDKILTTLDQLILNNTLQLKVMKEFCQLNIPKDVVKETKDALKHYQNLSKEINNFKQLTETMLVNNNE